MSVSEVSGLMKYKDEDGNVYLMFPVTTKDNVDGIDEIESELAALKQKVNNTPQADYNQNDDTALDYIKNRPFYEEQSVGYLLEETTLEVADSTAYLMNPLSGILVIGENYTVMYNGTEYECTATIANMEGVDCDALGNTTVFGGSTGADMPFAILIIPEDMIDSTGGVYAMVMVMVMEELTSITLSISGAISVIHTISDKYLPPSKNSFILNGSQIGSLRTIYSAEENDDYTIGSFAFAEGNFTKASGDYSHAEGDTSLASGQSSHAEGNSTASGIYSHAEGNSTASGNYSHAEGNNTIASGKDSHAEGYRTKASGEYSHAEGYDTKASGEGSHTEGRLTVASGKYSHAEGSNISYAGGSLSTKTLTSEDYAGITEDISVLAPVAYGISSHAEGTRTIAYGHSTHAEGNDTSAYGNYSHAEGSNTSASGIGSHAEGEGTIASGDYSHVQGKHNVEDTANKYAHIVGNGDDADNRSNAHTIDWEGNGWFAGKIKMGGTSQDDENSVEVASTSTVDSKVSTHNTSTSAHNDIRDLISGLTTRLNTLANSDDTTLDQLSEIVSYIKNNKSLIDGVTTAKVNVSDIVDNLTTSNASKPLSAKQGVAIKALIDALQTAVDGKATSSHTHNYAGSSSAGGAATSANKINTDAGSATNPVYFSNGIPVKTTYTLGKSVPSDAKFTDTTYSAATTSANGLMSSTDKVKLNNTNIAYGTCSTAADTAAKVVTLSGNTNWALTIGSVVMVSFTNSNSASNVTLNVNSTGAYPIWYNNAEYTSTGTAYTGYAGRVTTYMFNGTHWVWVANSYDTNTTYTNVKLGHGYASCTTAAATTAKVATLSSYTLTTGGIVAVKFTNAVPAFATLNINSKGAKAIYHKGAAIKAGVINAGETATFIYSGQYHLISIDRDVALKATADGNGNNIVDTYATKTELSDAVENLNITKVEQSDLESEVENQLDGAKADIVTQIIAQLGGMPVFGTVNNDNTITVTSTLADGDYVLMYENDNGTLEEIGTITVSNGEVTGGYTNIIDTVGYTNDTRLSTSTAGTTKAATGFVTTGIIDLSNVSKPVTIRTKGVDFSNAQSAVTTYNSSGTATYGLLVSNLITDDETILNTTLDADNNLTIVISADASDAYSQIQLCGYGSGENLIVTINEEITTAYTNIIDTFGYSDGYRISTSTGALSAQDGYTTTGLMTIPSGSTIRTKGVDFNYNSTYCNIGVYDSAGTKLSTNNLIGQGTSVWNGLTWSFDDEGNLLMNYSISSGEDTYIKISGYGSGADLIVTINEEIV